MSKKVYLLLQIIFLSTLCVQAVAVSYELNSARSSLNFVSTKQSHVAEVFKAEQLSGSISDTGSATLLIDLEGIESGIDLRNDRLRSLLFETHIFDRASVSISVDVKSINTLAIGQSMTYEAIASVDLHGMVVDAATQLSVSKLQGSDLLVRSTVPILINAADFNLVSGIDALREIGNLQSISYTVPVSFTLLYNAI